MKHSTTITLGILTMFAVGFGVAEGQVIHGSIEAGNQDNDTDANTLIVTRVDNGTVAAAGTGNRGDFDMNMYDSNGTPILFADATTILFDGIVNDGWGIATTAQNGRADGLTVVEGMYGPDGVSGTADDFAYPLSTVYPTVAFRNEPGNSTTTFGIIMDIAGSGGAG